MTDAFSLPSLFFGIYMTIPLVFGCLLLFGVNVRHGSLYKAQRLAGILLVLDAVYLIVRTTLIAKEGLQSPTLRPHFFVLDSACISTFILIPYTVIAERYPKWWMYLLALAPTILLPIIYQTGAVQIAIWSHTLPTAASIAVLFLSIKYAREADKDLTDAYANPEGYEKSWIIWLCAGFITVTVASFIRYLLPGFSWYNLLVNCLWSALMVAIYVLLVHQKATNTTEEVMTDSTSKMPVELKEDTKNHIKEQIGKALTQKCIEEKMYINSDLSAEALAKECGTNRTYLATYLRETFHQNFYEYVNTLRLQHVDELLSNNKLSQEDVAVKCGFSNARTMRRAYLKLRGKELSRDRR